MLKLQRGLQRCGKPCPHLSVCSARSLFVCFLFVFFLSACSTVRGSGTVYFNVIFKKKKPNRKNFLCNLRAQLFWPSQWDDGSGCSAIFASASRSSVEANSSFYTHFWFLKNNKLKIELPLAAFGKNKCQRQKKKLFGALRKIGKRRSFCEAAAPASG